MGRGGKREGAGRPKSGQEETKAFRLQKLIGEKAKSGYYEDLEILIDDWLEKQVNHSGKTRDWTRMNEFLEEYRKLKDNHFN